MQPSARFSDWNLSCMWVKAVDMRRSPPLFALLARCASALAGQIPARAAPGISNFE